MANASSVKIHSGVWDRTKKKKKKKREEIIGLPGD
jgi:hypothetical protein